MSRGCGRRRAGVEDTGNVKGDEACESCLSNPTEAKEANSGIWRTELGTSEEEGGPGGEWPLHEECENLSEKTSARLHLSSVNDFHRLLDIPGGHEGEHDTDIGNYRFESMGQL